MKLKRTHNCGELRSSQIGQEIILNGWVGSRRDHGGVVFVDLRDRYGLTQVVFSPAAGDGPHKAAEKFGPEYVVAVRGNVRARPEGTVNANLPTGEIEVEAIEVEVLNKSEPPPYELDSAADVSAETRLACRFFDLRSPMMQRSLIFRSRLNRIVRNYFDAHGFVEVETPVLTKSTPEGARDYLVPSRLNRGSFYALPQSPQLFKQILMVAGYDRYAQIVRCFRDEDLRADRQPEFTQLDMEMAFVEEEDVMTIMEGLMAVLWQELLGKKLDLPLKRIPYDEALSRYGNDKPDIRFGMELVDVTQAVADSGFGVFEKVAASGGMIKGIRAPGGAAKYSRKDLDMLTEWAKGFGAQGLAWLKVEKGALVSPIAKFLSDSARAKLSALLAAEEGDLLLFVADKPAVVAKTLSELRLRLGAELGRIPTDRMVLCWVVDFPMFEWNPDEKRYQALHHPFTSPKPEFWADLEKQPDAVKARAYDLVLNGSEIGGGSIRIHDPALQSRVFKLLGIDEQIAEERFGFLLKALRYGAPPHGGIALGMDRIAAILQGLDSIRDVIAFPKTQKAICLMSKAPSTVDDVQLRELGLRIVEE